jgi:hypothetical protein
MGVASIFEKLKGTLERAKETSDIAQQLNLGTRDIAGVQAAGRRIKIGERAQGVGLLSLEASRSAALAGGDQGDKLLAYFTQYLAPGNPALARKILAGPASVVDIGRGIAQSLGSGGINNTDATGLRQLMGGGATRMIALFREMGELDEKRMKESEHQIEALAQLNKTIEEVNAKLEYMWKRVPGSDN